MCGKIVVLTVVRPPAVQCSVQQRQRRYIVDLLLPMRQRESTHDSARSSSTWSAWSHIVVLCFLVRQGSRGVLLHHHCLKLAGPPRVHVARQLFCQACTACGGAT